MQASTTLLLAAGVTVAGRWSQGKKVTPAIAVGGVISALMLSFLEDGAGAPIARGLAALVLVAVVLTYVGPLLANISKSTGGGK